MTATSGRATELRADPLLTDYTNRLVEAHELSYLSNVQFRYDTTGNPWLLEVN